jgi:hydroxyquinol 1,2-dioxygenase
LSTELTRGALTQAVLNSFSDTQDQRLKSILTSLVAHLHDFVSEVAPTIEEWEQAIDFLTRTGHLCDEFRQEFILLSDVLGVSMLVETISDAETPGATDSTVLGPFHVVDSPARELGDDISPGSEGEPCVVRGHVRSVTGEAIGDAEIDIWQADAKGFYDVQQPADQDIGNGRGLLHSDADGGFWFRSIVPSPYPIPTDGTVGQLLAATGRHPYRPAHIHFLVTAPGYRSLTTHIFVEGSSYLDSDAVFAVKESLIVPLTVNDDRSAAAERGTTAPFREAVIELVMYPEGVAGRPGRGASRR